MVSSDRDSSGYDHCLAKSTKRRIGCAPTALARILGMRLRDLSHRSACNAIEALPLKRRGLSRVLRKLAFSCGRS